MDKQFSDEVKKRTIAEIGEPLLRTFHSEYEKDPVSPQTEFWRGKFTCWRQMLYQFYGEAVAQEMVEGVSERTRLSIPPGGELSPDRQGYLGWDSGCHMAIGRL